MTPSMNQSIMTHSSSNMVAIGLPAILCIKLKSHLDDILSSQWTQPPSQGSNGHSILSDISKRKELKNSNKSDKKQKGQIIPSGLAITQHQVMWMTICSSSSNLFSLAMYHATSMRQLFSDYSTAYLCGHLHDGAGKIRRMQHLHQNGLAELELADWKHSRIFRILSFDHDIFSFTDFSWRKSSIFIHITHPPNWQLTNPEKQVIHIGSRI